MKLLNRRKYKNFKNPAGIAQIANTAIVRGATVDADEANAYDNLHATYDM